MTLVIAQRLKGIVSLSADTRISFKEAGKIDFGIKVFSVPINIDSPTDSQTRKTITKYSYHAGMAVVGSAINAYTVKESLYEILQHLQYAPSLMSISFEKIAKLVYKIYSITTEEIRHCFKEKDGYCAVVLAGYCPEKSKVRVYLFTMEYLDEFWQPRYKEILEDEGIMFFGSGEKEAKIIYKQNYQSRKLEDNTPLKIIRQVINEQKVASVGGWLQYGSFIDRSFKVYGVIKNVFTKDESFDAYQYKLRGVDIYNDELKREDDDFHISYPFVDPFRDEIDDYINNM